MQHKNPSQILKLQEIHTYPNQKSLKVLCLPCLPCFTSSAFELQPSHHVSKITLMKRCIMGHDIFGALNSHRKHRQERSPSKNRSDLLRWLEQTGGGGSSIAKVPGDVPPTRVYL